MFCYCFVNCNKSILSEWIEKKELFILNAASVFITWLFCEIFGVKIALIHTQKSKFMMQNMCIFNHNEGDFTRRWHYMYICKLQTK